ncbi:hypothetical protein [Acidiphilium acidophilum]|uniref:hypothetical protein n=1 Tax=Acidiphilium acidophilum TaxID=76588 RepID=UPI002E8E7993|nr:hypothetical protein [Acidiphilium acidophilum]
MDINMNYVDEKRRMEEALQLDPDNRSVLDEYFDILRNISMRSLGLFTARLPGIANPIYLRANTSDILNFGQIFLNDEYGFEFLVEPRRILDLGGYAGYAALYLNRRFPQAEIVSVEPSVDNYGMLRLNTVNVTRISAVNGAIWNVPGFVGRSGLEDEHWGHRISVIDDSNKQSRSIEGNCSPPI